MHSFKRSTNKLWEYEFDNLKFSIAARCAPKKGWLSYVHVRGEGERAIETCDGHRAHRWLCKGFARELTPGFYRVLCDARREIQLDCVEERVKFPDLDRVLPPDFFTSSEIDATVNFGDGVHADCPFAWAGAIRQIAHLIPADSRVAFNWRFFDPFQGYWGARYQGDSPLWLFDDERGLRAAIMPLSF